MFGAIVNTRTDVVYVRKIFEIEIYHSTLHIINSKMRTPKRN